MRPNLAADALLIVQLRIPMRGYEDKIIDRCFAHKVVTNPHAGL